MTKCLIVFPPQWSPFSPHLAPVVIASTISHSGRSCAVMDLNAEFYNEVIKKDYLESAAERMLQSIDTLKKELKDIIIPGKPPEEYPYDVLIKIKRLLFFSSIKSKKMDIIKRAVKTSETAAALLRDKKDFYNLLLASNSVSIINSALELASMEEYPQELSFYNYLNRVIKLDYSHILEYCSRENLFRRFYKSRMNDILNGGYDCIGISISAATQLFAGLTLSKMLKEEGCSAKIFLGGNHISRITETLQNHPEFFKTFTDYVIFEEGERAVLDFLDYMEGKSRIDDVSSILYLNQHGKIVQTEKKAPAALSELPELDLDGFPLNKYFLPEIIMPVRLSRGCYWKKCTFCDHYFGQTYNVKDTQKLISELRNLQEKYGINNFEFTDDCISPAYLRSFSQEVIKSGLKINWYCDLRLENAFTQELLELAYKAGLKMVLWGFEAGSKRVMELINKGIDIDRRFEILKRAADAGIYNFAYIFFGFPTETYEEALETVKAAAKTDIIHSFGTGRFTLGRHSMLNFHPEEYGITKIEDNEDFAVESKFTAETGMTEQEIWQLESALSKQTLSDKSHDVWRFLLYRELLFLYIVKYGRDKVLNMRYIPPKQHKMP